MHLKNPHRVFVLDIFRSGLFVLSFAISFHPLAAHAQEQQAELQPSKSRIFVDPDVRVSYDGDVVHMEAYAAASATNPDLLVAGGELIIPGRKLFAPEARIYRSVDAGARWSPVLLPDEINGGWDNAVAGGIGGDAYFLTSNYDRGLTVYRTNDGGVTWIATVLTAAAGWDRPHVAVDVTASAYRGRFYVAGEAEDGVRVMSTSDGGKTFSPPVTACPHPAGWNAATNASPLVLSDGTLVVPCAPYPNNPERATWSNAEVGTVTSRDGGQTFGAYHKMGVVHRALDHEMYSARVRGDVLLSGNFMQGPSFAAALKGAQFADRIYAAWQDIDAAGHSRILSAWSADCGETWSTPIQVDSSRAPDGKVPTVRQAVPMVGVTPDGALGVAWFDGRLAPDGKGYDVYFAASLDGGSTFLPPVRVSTATSRPEQGLNLLPALEVADSSPNISSATNVPNTSNASNSTNAKVVVHMSSPFADRATGGDYSSMAVDAAGRFHPFWADARTGTWQLYSAVVRVLSAASLTNLPKQDPCTFDSSHTQLLFGEPEWRGTTNEVVVPVRLVNTSTNTIVDAITVRAAPELSARPWAKEVSDAAALAPKIFDDARGTFAESARFVYQPSATAPLFPNSVTVPLEWRLHVPVAHFMDFSFQVEITGGGCPKK